MIPFFFKPFRIAAGKTNTDLLSVDDHCEPWVSVFDVLGAVTWWKLHLSEAFDRSWNAVAINQDVKFLPDALMSGVWHIQDVAWCFPAIQYIWDERILKKKLQRKTDYMEFCDKELTLFL